MASGTVKTLVSDIPEWQQQVLEAQENTFLQTFFICNRAHVSCRGVPDSDDPYGRHFHEMFVGNFQAAVIVGVNSGDAPQHHRVRWYFDSGLSGLPAQGEYHFADSPVDFLRQFQDMMEPVIDGKQRRLDALRFEFQMDQRDALVKSATSNE